MKDAQDLQPAELLTVIFEQGGQPLEFERVVGLASEVWNITDAPLESVDDPDHESIAESLPPTPRIDLLLEQRLYLEKLWAQVCQLPVLQRAALLLNLRDANGSGAIFFIVYLGLASQSQIAEVLELPQEKFSELWNDLPLDDSRIARILGVTRQQVINLRKTARERLIRRMEKMETTGLRDITSSNKLH